MNEVPHLSVLNYVRRLSSTFPGGRLFTRRRCVKFKRRKVKEKRTIELNKWPLRAQHTNASRADSLAFNNYVAYALITPESCVYHRCLSCHPDDAASPGSPIECHPSNWVTAQWIHNLGHPPPSTDSKVPVEYRCLKMVATPDDKSLGNTVDVIRGCVPKVQVDSN
ncbi:hypothetical protein MSG28_013262 [Choristoneura fumiferana]|uniref:Uncharacterized protein n=1 Tax=Choristoneura fumiferana TaxID=7141 RepID=A0ACC0KSJ8_CHOFU|nr:hypothetical protein MSG28_013262 [Choristoneura fumiferana]